MSNTSPCKRDSSNLNASATSGSEGEHFNETSASLLAVSNAMFSTSPGDGKVPPLDFSSITAQAAGGGANAANAILEKTPRMSKKIMGAARRASVMMNVLGGQGQGGAAGGERAYLPGGDRREAWRLQPLRRAHRDVRAIMARDQSADLRG